MATTSLWEIHQRLDKVIDYTTNEEKTKEVDQEHMSFFRWGIP